MKNIIIMITWTNLFFISCSSISDKEQVKDELMNLNIVLTDSFKILEIKHSGLTDYTLDFELSLDSLNFSRISGFIMSQTDFFIGDTTDNFKYFNNHPYIKNNQLFWEEYSQKDISYEYRRIEADIKTRTIKYHYLKE